MRGETTFLSECQGISEEDSEIGRYIPTDVQTRCLKAIHAHRRVFINKYRQAKVTTATAIGFMFPRVMYTPGIHGVLLADTDRTAMMIMRRIVFAYNRLHPYARIPLSAKNDHYIEFTHGGSITVVPGGSRAPGIGDSVDVLDLSELCAVEDQEALLREVLPGFIKRKAAYGFIESTPGKRESTQYDLWIKALEGGGFWVPLFLKWYEDPTCYIEPPPGHFQLANDEVRLIEEFPFLKPGHINFIRWCMSAGIGINDYRGFRNKYPMDEYDGWMSLSHPVMPEDAIKRQLARALPDPMEDLDFKCCIYEGPQTGEDYLVTADPNSYGQEGDPSGHTVWKMSTRTEVAVHGGREDVGRNAHRGMHIARKYNNAILVPESNAAAYIATVVEGGYKHIYYTNPAHPGWYATSQGLLAAEARLVQMLRDDEIHIRSKATLHQGLEYDGSKRKARDSGGGHFDRWRTVIIAADLLNMRAYVRPGRREIGPPAFPHFVDEFNTISYAQLVENEKRRQMTDQENSFLPVPWDGWYE